ncbi:MAG: hypothetical protein H7199_02135 [Burkholderiales bacterium]|nr:hypothetical protein [Flavobacterium sp.]
MKTTIKITSSGREGVANELSKILADEYVLFTAFNIVTQFTNKSVRRMTILAERSIYRP